MSEVDWCKLPKMERARKVVALKLEDWFSALEHWKMNEDMKRK